MSDHHEMANKKELERSQRETAPGNSLQFLSPRILLLCWFLFFLLMGGVLVAWLWNVTQYAQGVGMIQPSSKNLSELAPPGQKAQIVAILFFPAQFSQEMRKGAFVQIQIEGIAQAVRGNIERFDPTVLRPEEARQRYNLSTQVASDLVSPVFVAIVSLSPPVPSSVLGGNSVKAQFQLSTFNLLAFL